MKINKTTLEKVGSLSQLAGTRHCLLTGGGPAGLKAVDVNTGSGLCYTVLSDRGMDISEVTFKGMNLTYISPQKAMHPAYFDPSGDNWLDMFFGGLLTTCGPRNIGAPCVENNEYFNMHGKHNLTPATNFCDTSHIEEKKIELMGTIGQYHMFGEKLETKRVISSKVGESYIDITDTITNKGDEECPFMLLYHINFGYPLLDDHVEIAVNSNQVTPANPVSVSKLDNIHEFEVPSVNNSELNYLHHMDADSIGEASISNKAIGIRVRVQFHTDTLPYLTQWKYARARDYILGLEPCTSTGENRETLRKNGTLDLLQPDESCTTKIRILVDTLE